MAWTPDHYMQVWILVSGFSNLLQSYSKVAQKRRRSSTSPRHAIYNAGIAPWLIIVVKATRNGGQAAYLLISQCERGGATRGCHCKATKTGTRPRPAVMGFNALPITAPKARERSFADMA